MSKLSEKSLEDLSREELEKLKLYSEFEKNQAQQEKARQESHAVRMRVVWQPVTVLLGIIVAAFLIWNYTQPIFEKETTLTKLDSAIAMKRIELKQAVLDSSNRALKLSNARFWTSFEQYTNRLDTILSQSNSELARTRTEIAEERSKRPPNHTLLSALEERRQTIQKLIEHTADAKRRMGLIRHPLRSEPNHSLSEEMAKRAIQELDFYDVTRNEEGGKNRYPLKVIFKNGDKLVVDEVYELMWQANDDGPMAWSTQETALYSVQEARYGGFDNWRLPTLEEAMSLMRPIKHNKSYIDSVFTQSDTGVITSDRNGRRCFWIVDYSSGYYMCGGVADFGGLTARAVRTMDQSK